MKKLRKNSFCALNSPRWTCASVPQNTSTIPSPSSTTVSFSEVKILTSRSSMSVLRVFHELRERFFLAVHNFCVAHQFVEPDLSFARQNRTDEFRGLSGARILAGQFHQRGFSACGFQRRGCLLQFRFARRRQTELPAPAIHVRGQPAAIAGRSAHIDRRLRARVAGDHELCQKKLAAGNLLPTGWHLP